ncbi:amidohydrolase family protein [Aquimarina rhabdastrellae]
MKYLSLLVTLIAMFFVSCSDDNGNTTNEWVIESSPVIDMHLHTAIDFRGDLTEEDFEAFRVKTYEKIEKYNIVKAMLSGINFASASWYERDPERIIPGNMVGGLGMPTVEELRQVHKDGKLQVMGEVGFYYQGLYANQEEVKPYFSMAEELGMPVAYHLMDNVSPDNANPLQFEEVLMTHPNLKIYLMHAGWPYIEEMKVLLAKYPLLYVDISWIFQHDGFDVYLKDLIDSGYGQRILYGSDPVESPEIIDTSIQAINNLTFLTNAQKADIFYYNAARFLELSEDEIRNHWRN